MAAWKLAPVLAFGNIVTGLGETAGAAISGHPGIDTVERYL
jgi:acyl-CoA reductase-like NAD-dependent aldehyde dehydrogenase